MKTPQQKRQEARERGLLIETKMKKRHRRTTTNLVEVKKKTKSSTQDIGHHGFGGLALWMLIHHGYREPNPEINSDTESDPRRRK